MNSIKNTVHYISESMKSQEAKASKEANKVSSNSIHAITQAILGRAIILPVTHKLTFQPPQAVAKDGNNDLSTRTKAAKNAVHDKISEKKHKHKSDVHKEVREDVFWAKKNRHTINGVAVEPVRKEATINGERTCYRVVNEDEE